MANPILRAFAKLNAVVYRMSGGRVMGKMGSSAICVVRMQGARSQTWRDVPLMYVAQRRGRDSRRLAGRRAEKSRVVPQPRCPSGHRSSSQRHDLAAACSACLTGGKTRRVAEMRGGVSSVRGLSKAHDTRHSRIHLRSAVGIASPSNLGRRRAATGTTARFLMPAETAPPSVSDPR